MHFIKWSWESQNSRIPNSRFPFCPWATIGFISGLKRGSCAAGTLLFIGIRFGHKCGFGFPILFRPVLFHESWCKLFVLPDRLIFGVRCCNSSAIVTVGWFIVDWVVCHFESSHDTPSLENYINITSLKVSIGYFLLRINGRCVAIVLHILNISNHNFTSHESHTSARGEAVQ